MPILYTLKENFSIVLVFFLATITTLSHAFSVDYITLIDRLLGQAQPPKARTAKPTSSEPRESLQSPTASPELDPSVKDTITQMESQAMTNASQPLEMATQRNETATRAPKAPLTGIEPPAPTMKTPNPAAQPLSPQEKSFESPAMGFQPMERKSANATDFPNFPDPTKPQAIPGAPASPQDPFAPTPAKANAARTPEPGMPPMPPGFSAQPWGAR